MIALSQAGKSSLVLDALKGDTTRGLGVFMSMAGGMFLTSYFPNHPDPLEPPGNVHGKKADDQLPLLMQSHLEYSDSSPLPKSEGGIKSEMGCLEV